MSRHSLRIFGGVGLATIILIVGATAGGGAVYALSQNQAGDPATQETVEEPGIVIVSVAADGPAAQAVRGRHRRQRRTAPPALRSRPRGSVAGEFAGFR